MACPSKVWPAVLLLMMNASIGLAPAGMTIKEGPSFAKMPIYNFDDQQATGFPKDADALNEAVRAADGVLIVSSEYNWSIPGGLKNAIDWASRPYGQNSFTRKPSAVIGTSPGAIGTAIAQQQLRSVLSFCNSPQMNAPEAYIQFSPGLITADGHVTNETTATFLRDYMEQLHAFIVRVYSVLPRGT